MDSPGKFEESSLAPMKEFYSMLYDEEISEGDYEHAKRVWDELGLINMGDYYDLYLKSDVPLLADVFENFKKTCLQYYGLDPCHYFTSPGLSWDAMLKMTKVELELMTDIDMFQFIERGLRGGVSSIMHRHGKANNKYLSNYDPEEESKYLMYLDTNNLYGWAMRQYMPTGGFRWLDPDKTGLWRYRKNSQKGVILGVDIDYPAELHGSHNSFPLAPEKIKVTDDMLSDYCKKYQQKYSISVGGSYKLIPSLLDKKKSTIGTYNSVKN